MLRLLLLVLFLTSTVVSADERQKEVANALTKIQEEKAKAQTWEGKNSDQPYIALVNEYETRINPDWSYTEDYHVRVKIQQDAARELGEWPLYYNKAREEIVDIKAFVETPEGKKVAATQIQNLQAYDSSPMYSDMMIKVITLPEVNIGSIIDVTVKTKTIRKEIPNHFWDEVPYPVIPTKYARHTYIFPKDKPIEFKISREGLKPVIERKDDTVKYSFVFAETEFTEEEDLMPPPDEINGGAYLSSIKDWKVVADWYRQLVYKNTIEDAQITLKTLELAKGKANQKEKARAILEYIQDNFRYVSLNFGDHTVEPHRTNEVFKNKYGDCKDLALLTRQMFKLAGIDSNIALMNSEFSGDPQKGTPSPSQFEHVVLETTLDGQKYFVDPQTKGFDFGQFPYGYDNAHLLVIEDADFRFDHLPITSEKDHTLISKSDVNIRLDGSAVFTVEVKLPLEASIDFRNRWQSTSNQDKDRFFESLEANFSQGGNMISREVKGLEDRYGEVAFNFKYDSPTAYPLVNDMLLLKEADQSDVPDFAAPSRKYPIFFPTNSLIRNTNIYRVPPEFKIDFVPQDFDLSIDFAQVSTRYEADQTSVKVDTTYRLKRATIPPSRYAKVREFRNQLYEKNDQYVVLKKRSQTSEKAKDWIKKQ
jgi:hypothetical protein